MGTFLTVLALLIIGTFVMVRIAVWVSHKSPIFRNVVAFCLAGGASYSAGFVFNMWVLASTGGIVPPSNVIWPTWTWLSITTACLVAAFQTIGSPYALAIPFFLNAILVFSLSPSLNEVIFIAMPLFLVSVATFFYRRKISLGTKYGTISSVPVGIYKLNGSIKDVNGLIEFSPVEYRTMGRQFGDEKNYNAPPVLFLGRSWKVLLQTVHSQICKIALHIEPESTSNANAIAMQTFQYCTELLGKPTKQITGLFVWDATDGNAVLQIAETAEGHTIGFFLTSSAIRDFKLF